jgi:tetratricopeptide (TPR) repeat protein
MERAQRLLEVGRPADAVTTLAAYLAEHPADPDALSLLSSAYLRDDRPEDAVRAADAALAAEPAAVAAWRSRSEALRRLHRYEEAIEAARRYVELAPNSWLSHYTLGLAVRQVPARRAELLPTAMLAVRLAPDNADAHVLLGLAYDHVGDPIAAAECYRRALSLNPDNAYARSNLSALDLRRGRFQAAMRGFRQAASQRPQETMFHRNIAATTVSSLTRRGHLLAVLSIPLATTVCAAAGPSTETPANWLIRLGALAVLVLAWLTMGWLRLRPLSTYLRAQAGQVFRSLLRDRRFLPLFVGTVGSQVCVLAMLVVPAPLPLGALTVGALAACTTGVLTSRMMARE